jgi:hypothetical protein
LISQNPRAESVFEFQSITFIETEKL